MAAPIVYIQCTIRIRDKIVVTGRMITQTLFGNNAEECGSDDMKIVYHTSISGKSHCY